MLCKNVVRLQLKNLSDLYSLISFLLSDEMDILVMHITYPTNEEFSRDNVFFF